jgi:hypothetical protein
MPAPSEIRKAVAALVGALAVVASTLSLSGTALTVVNAIIAAATALGVYAAPNTPSLSGEDTGPGPDPAE